jgi:hypothetical protein
MAEVIADGVAFADDQPASPRNGHGLPIWVGLIHRAGWLLVGGLAVCLCADPPQWLDCRCGFGPVKYHTASIGYGLVAGRAVVAAVLRERSCGWITQLFLLVVLAPLVEIIVTAAGGH